MATDHRATGRDDVPPSTCSELDRRSAVRITCELPATCRTAREAAGLPGWWGVRDVSADGLQLVSRYQLAPGVMLSVQLPADMRPLAARVVYGTRDADGGWLIGCRFLQSLSRDELAVLSSRLQDAY